MLSARSQRRAAYDVLSEVERGAYANLALKTALPSLPEKERAFCSALVYGVLEKKLWLDSVIKKYAPRPSKPAVTIILRMGAYQLLYMDVPRSAAVNESVKLVKELGKGGVAGFVNGVLRALSRDADSVVPPVGNDAVSLSLRHSWPLWIAERFVERFGGDGADALLSACEKAENSTPVRAVGKGATAALEAMGLLRGAIAPEIFYAKGDIAATELFKEGGVTVQSEGSALICRVCGVDSGDRVLDACAAPGGKTAYLSSLAAHVDSWDIHPHRVALIESTCLRLGAKNVTASVCDASVPHPELSEKYDVVLVDAPCSGLGVVAGKPDLKYGKTPENVAELAALQLKILFECSRYVRPGGALVYSTCTVSTEENEGVADAFLTADTLFYPDDITRFLPEGFDVSRCENGRVQLLPHLDGCDGFFVCRMIKGVTA